MTQQICQGQDETFVKIEKHVSLVLSYWKEHGYWNKYIPGEDTYEGDVLQDAYLVVLTAMQEHDPEKGKLTTCIRKVARRYLMRKRRHKQRRQLEDQAVQEYAERECHRAGRKGVH